MTPVLDTRRQRKDGSYPVVVRFSHNREQITIPLNEYVRKEEFMHNQVVKRPDMAKINSSIASQLSVIVDKIYDLERAGTLQSLSGRMLRSVLNDELHGRENGSAVRTVLDTFVEYMEKAEKPKTREAYKFTLDMLRKRCDPGSMQISDIDFRFVSALERILKKDGLATNTVSIHMRNLRRICNYSIDCGYVGPESYPFRRFKIKSEPTRKRALTFAQLRQLAESHDGSFLDRYIDIFLIIFCMMGINMVDLFALKKGNVAGERIEYKRAKTGHLYSIKIEPELRALMEKYGTGTDNLFSFVDGVKCHSNFLHRFNLCLGELGKRIGAPDLTSYWARHSWATCCANIGIGKDVISHGLGHQSGNRITDIYIDFDMKLVDEANRRVLDELFRTS